jgi:uncharacterized membrane-anchored protein YitT (DUF2179 family)
MRERMKKDDFRQLVIIIIGSIIISAAFNLFFIPHNILSSGLSGIAIMLGLITPFDTGLLNFVLNLPLLIIGTLKLGKRFIIFTIISVVVTSLGLYIIPVTPIGSEPILSSIFGGVLGGLGAGVILKVSGSSGGFDIVAVLLTRKKDIPLGSILSGLNAIVVIFSGFIFGWDSALNTLIGIYASGKVIDTIHTRHIKLTLMIVTKKGEVIQKKLLENFYRGITIMEGYGAYTGERKKILMTVITRYQLTEIKKLIKEIDPQAFVNITETKEVLGSFDRSN